MCSQTLLEEATVKATTKILGKQAVSEMTSQMIKSFAQTISRDLIKKTLIKMVIKDLAIRVVTGVIAETFEEIVVDSFVETGIQNLIGRMGGTQAFGYWLSTFATTARETKMFGFLTSGFGLDSGVQTNPAFEIISDIRQKFSERFALESAPDLFVAEQLQENAQEILNMVENFQSLTDSQNSLKKTVVQLLGAGAFTLFNLFIPSFGGFNFFGIKQIFDLTGKAYSVIDLHKQRVTAEREIIKREASEQLLSRLYKPTVEPAIETENKVESPVVETVPMKSGLLTETSIMEADVLAMTTGIDDWRGSVGLASPRMSVGQQMDSFLAGEAMRKRLDMELNKAEKDRVESNMVEITMLDGGVSQTGDLGNIMNNLKSSNKYNSKQLTRIESVLRKFQGILYNDHEILQESGVYGAINYHVISSIMDRLSNDVEITDLEKDILNNLKIFRPSPSHSRVYTALFDEQNSQYYAAFYKFFLSSIAKTLNKYSVIKIDPSLSLINAVKEFTVAIGMGKESLWRRISRIQRGEQENLDEYSLDEIYLSLEKLVFNTGFLPDSVSYECLMELTKHFEFYYYISGFLSKNSFYSEAKYMVLRLKHIVDEAHEALKNKGESGIPGYSGTILSLDRDILVGVSITNLYLDLKDSKQVTRPVTIDSFRSVVDSVLEPYLSADQLNQIYNLLADYKSKLFSYYETVDKLESYENSIRKSFINDIIVSQISPVLKQACTTRSLSNLIFGDRDELDTIFFSKNVYIHSRPRLYEILHIRMRVFTWTVQDFVSEGLEISSNDLELLKEEILEKIDAFIKFNKDNYALLKMYSEPGIGKEEYEHYKSRPFVYLEGESQYNLELNVIQAFYFAASVFNKEKITMPDLAKIIGYGGKKVSGLYHPLNTKYHFTMSSVMKIGSKLESFIKKDTVSTSFGTTSYDFMSRLSLDQRQAIYAYAKEQVRIYMKLRNIDRPKSWNKDYMVAYHVLSLLKRDLGFDVLTFTRLKESIFVKGRDIEGDTFARHHFRDDLFKKLSLNVPDLLLTYGTHRSYEGYSEAEILVILQGFAKLKEMKGNYREDGKLTRQDVIDVFRGNEWVLNGRDDADQNGWFKNPDFQDELDAFNDRRDYIKLEGTDEFIRKFYKPAYNRFYINFPHGSSKNRNVALEADGFYSLVEPNPWLSDYMMFVNVELGSFSRLDFTNKYWNIPFR